MRMLANSLLTVLLATPGVALACTCALNPPVPEAVDDSSRVFLGTVTSIERHDGLLQRVTFQVSEHFKGSSVPTVQVENHAYGPMCGYPFQEGARYIVYAQGDEGELQTSSCSRTTVANATGSDLEDLRAAN